MGKSRRDLHKTLELAKKRHALEQYEEHLDKITGLHRECGPVVDWTEVLSEQERKISFTEEMIKKMATRLDDFKPSLWNKLFGTSEKSKVKLRKKIAISKDVLSAQEQNKSVAIGVLNKDYEAYNKALEQFGSRFFGIINGSVSIDCNSLQVSEMDVVVDDLSQVIPDFHMKVTPSGKISILKMTKKQTLELEREYFSSCAVRAAREVFSVLPVEHVLVTIFKKQVDPADGHEKKDPLISAFLPRASIAKARWENTDASSFIENQEHNMEFSSTKGWKVVPRLVSSMCLREKFWTKEPDLELEKEKCDFSIRYIDKEFSLTERVVSLMGLAGCQDGDLMLRCHCRKRNEERDFLLSRIVEMTDLETGEVVNRPFKYIVDKMGLTEAR